MSLRPALFLDRDGVINEEVGYLHRAEDCRFLPGIASLLQTARSLGYVSVVITNQAGIARGLYTEEDFHRLMRYMEAELAKQGAALDAIYFSPYHPTHGIDPYRRESECRKPAPGMLLRAAAEHSLDLRSSTLIGDRCSDLVAGHAAGVADLYLVGKTETSPCPVPFAYNLVDSLDTIEEQLRLRQSATSV